MRQLLIISFMLITSIAVGQTYQCGTKTQSGTSCVRRVIHQGEKCYQHGGTTKAQKSGATVVPSAPCGAITKAGTPCKNPVKGGGKCHLHKQ